ncbi:DUF2793 domain-containing protein [Marinobacter sp. DS40M6]|uniref:DUF2793 domain-containing protein n=1 Tax=Marinobacter sp. DS40M6 TaxID=1597776 RepID=UPI00235A1717|nr:DUF2793 domain-containing protein [Marinobacter sp. DS40M6]MDC8457812.1 DUF2793 domain-containing protein [Marinobacter sp. DS40M6]
MPLQEPKMGLYHSWALGESGWNEQNDYNILTLAALAQLTCITRGVSTPPVSPSNGDTYIVGPAPTGAWENSAGYIAVYRGDMDAWQLYQPRDGWRCRVVDEDADVFFNSGVWDYGPTETLARPSVNNQTGTSYTLVLTDDNTVVRCSNSSPFQLTVPLNSNVAFPAGTIIQVRQVGAGQVTLVPEAGVSILTPETLKTRKQGSTIAIMKVDDDTWDATGDLEVVP